jgi:serine/threonine-protein kinase RsbT
MNNDNIEELNINKESDIVNVRKIVRDIVTKMGFSITDITRIITATSELTRNIYIHAGTGIMKWHRINSNNNVGIELIFEDYGPGIPDINQAMELGYSTMGGLGMGLPGTKRLMDEMEIQSEMGKGTTVTVRKWLRRR